MVLNKKTMRNVFLIVASCIVLYWILHETDRVRSVVKFVVDIFSPFVAGAGIAFVLNVPMRAFEKLLKKVNNPAWRRVIAVLLTVVAVLLVLSLVFWLLIPQLTQTITNDLIPAVEKFISNSTTFATGLISGDVELPEWAVATGIADNIITALQKLDWATLAQKAISFIQSSAAKILNGAVSAVGSVASAAMNVVIAIVFALYCLFQKENLARQGRKLLYAFVPEVWSDRVVRILRLTNSTFSNFFSGQCIEVCILGAMFAVAMAIFGMPYIPLISVLIAVTAFIPIVGAFIGCAVGAFLILMSNPLQALIFVAMFLIIQQIEGNLIYPRVVGSSIGLSGMWVLVAVTVGGELMGVAGMFLMIPMASVLYTLLRELSYKRLAQKEIDPEKLKEQPPELRSHIAEKHKKRKEKWALKKLMRLEKKKK